MDAVGSWNTRANALTLLRALLVPLWVAALLQGFASAALGLLLVAVATDLADGWVARRDGQASALGRLADHGVDALFVSAGAGALACRGLLPAVLPALIALAFLQYVLDSRALSGAPLRPSALGRWNGVAYYAAIGLPVLRDAAALQVPGDGALRFLGWLLVASTLLSMADRLRVWRRLRES